VPPRRRAIGRERVVLAGDDWNDEHRDDMQFALDEADAVRGLFAELLEKLERLAKT